MTPPLRTAEDREALAAGLRGGELDTLASDHCHLRLDEKLETLGDFSKIPTGLPGIGARLPIGFTLAPLSVERLVEVACAAPARIFGLAGKGAIAPGADADLVVWDPSRPAQLSLESIDDALDWTPYGGIERARDVPLRARARRSRGRGRALRRHRPSRRLPPGGTPCGRTLSYAPAMARNARSWSAAAGSIAGGVSRS